MATITVRLKWRTRAKQALESYFRLHSFPRLALGVVLILTGLAGFLLSLGLLRLGLLAMSVRFPAALIGSYAVFLALIRLWVEIEQRRFDPSAIIADGRLIDPKHEPEAKRGSLWTEWLDFSPGDLDLDGEGCLFAILLGCVVGLGLSLFVTICGASSLIGEVFLDAFLVAALYRRLRVAAREHWLGTALRKTWRTVFLWAVLLAIIGAILEILVPGQHTLTSALTHLHAPTASSP